MSQCCPPFPTILFQSWSRRGRVTRIWLGQVTGGQIFSHLLVEWWRKRKHTHGLEIAGTERRRLLLSNCFVNVVITLWPPSESGINAHWTDTDIIWVSSFLYFSEHVSKRRQTKRLWVWGDDELEWKVAIDLLDHPPLIVGSSKFQGELTLVLPGHLSSTFYLTCPSSSRFASATNEPSHKLDYYLCMKREICINL